MCPSCGSHVSNEPCPGHRGSNERKRVDSNPREKIQSVPTAAKGPSQIQEDNGRGVTQITPSLVSPSLILSLFFSSFPHAFLLNQGILIYILTLESANLYPRSCSQYKVVSLFSVIFGHVTVCDKLVYEEASLLITWFVWLKGMKGGQSARPLLCTVSTPFFVTSFQRNPRHLFFQSFLSHGHQMMVMNVIQQCFDVILYADIPPTFSLHRGDVSVYLPLVSFDRLAVVLK